MVRKVRKALISINNMTIKNITVAICIFAVLPAMAGRKADRKITDRVAIWQVEHHAESRHSDVVWPNGALYRGMFEWADFTGNERYFNFLRDIGERNGWRLAPRLYHADDICVGQMYELMYGRYGDEKMIAPLRSRMDSILCNPSSISIHIDQKNGTDRWTWCDALFMAPPVWLLMYNITGERKYLDFMDEEFRLTTEALYNREAGLYWRDCSYVGKKEKNGEDVYWGRGNGWVFAGLAILLEAMPQDHSTYGYYLQIFKDMAVAVVRAQDKKGSWHASMMDPESYPLAENSASGFFTYGLAWGCNHGVLSDSKYRKAALKGWKALKSYVHEDGFLGNVQPIGAAPGATGPDMTEVYGVGAFLLAGKQIQILTRRSNP